MSEDQTFGLSRIRQIAQVTRDLPRAAFFRDPDRNPLALRCEVKK